MKKSIIYLILLNLILFSLLPLACTYGFKIESPIADKDFESMTTRIGNWIYTIALVVFPLMIVIGGIMLATSSGDPGKTSLAKKIIVYAIIGFVIVFLARGIIVLVKMILGV